MHIAIQKGFEKRIIDTWTDPKQAGFEGDTGSGISSVESHPVE